MGKNHIEVIENKISKNIEVLYMVRHLLDFKNFLKNVYINYVNVAWPSTFNSRLHEILKKQKHAARITFHANTFSHSRQLLREMEVLNVYQANIIQTLKFMYKTKYGIFLDKFRVVDRRHATKFSQKSFYYIASSCKTTNFATTRRGLTIWNSFLS